MSFVTTGPSTPASWDNTGGDVRVHRVPAGTPLLEEGDPRGFALQVTTPLCGGATYHGTWTHRPARVAPFKPCTDCYPGSDR